jgi:lauroyl/myristoyl acyltransferase
VNAVKHVPPNKDRSQPLSPRWQAVDWHYKDLVSYSGLPAQIFVADFLPEAIWPTLARSLALFRAYRQPSWRRCEAAHIARWLGRDASDAAVSRIHLDMLTAIRLSQWWSLATRRRSGWRPRVRLVGREHIERALTAGAGAIIWVAPFAFAPLAFKITLADHGYGLVHLSRTTHGPAKSQWGARHVNRFFVAAEERFVRQRALIAADGSPTKALRQLARHLEGNGVVSIMAGGIADRPLTVPFLGATLRVAPGPPALAQRTGAALLPVFTILHADGAAVVHVEEPIGRASGTDAAVREFALRLEPHVLVAPAQFLWRYGMTRS